MLVYVGAVMVLFLFVVMMLDINVDALREGFWKHFPLAGAGRRRDRARDGGGAAAAASDLRRRAGRRRDAALKLGNTKLLGIELYTEYLYPLQIAAVMLLVAIIAAIALTLRQRKDTQAHQPVRPGARAARPTACAWSR